MRIGIIKHILPDPAEITHDWYAQEIEHKFQESEISGHSWANQLWSDGVQLFECIIHMK